MRLFVSLAVLGIAVAGLPAHAQQNQPTTAMQQAPYYGVPMYNSATGTSYQVSPGGAPIYNNSPGAQPLPLNQMVAGKNAPSYNYNKNTAYTGFSSDPLGNMDYANLTSNQRRMIEQQRQQRMAQEQAYLQSLQQQPQQANSFLQGANNFAPGANNMFMQQQQQQPKQRRVVYNERNNPLVAPPRLFNPDQ